ncbi:Pyroglutamyl-peptidase 1 [Perkinsus chesapeaki]|uniref:Pyroglutamyl-peptidase 1 n=1 Tax=Perkinsus chesapeaki TaxID=330153 RepID=A0A7J6MZ85_PERCH|nr:Pyroglutamyl-peptidase 1 [Perkinsus chesapeaki]
MTPEKSSAGVHVLLTGFGPFTGVTENPTQIVAEALDREPDKRIGAYSQYTVVDPAVEVSVGECERMSKAMADKAEALTGKALVLHMGVDAACDHFKLERTAYNLADFRVPDVKGAHLRGHKIIPEAPQELQTVVDVEAVMMLGDIFVTSFISTPCITQLTMHSSSICLRLMPALGMSSVGL